MNPRSLTASLHDLCAAAIAWMAGYALRFNFDIPPSFVEAMWNNLLWAIPLQAVIFHGFGLYRGIWRFASIPDLRRIALAAGTAGLAIPAVLLMFQRLNDVPRSVLVLHPLLLVLIMGGSRFLYRAWRDGQLVSPRRFNAEPVIVMGAGGAGAALLRDLAGSQRWRAVGLLDDDPAKLRLQLQGVSVLGQLDSVARVAAAHQVATVIVAMPSASPSARRHAVELVVGAGLKALTVPALADVLSGRVTAAEVRQVELEDLLGREQVLLDNEGLKEQLTGKSILVTGAGGSIGSELCRQIIRFAPAKLVFLEQSEFALYSIEQEFAGQPVCCVVGDVKDSSRLEAVFAEHKPDVVFHAAAYKHVPLMESANAWEAVRNNVRGTLNVARAALASGTSEFVLISTDKAVNPTNVMGASKRLAEVVCRAVQTQASATRFVMVRFGNVLGSSGSVIPRFRQQIAAGGPVTVTHPDIIRYFMLIPEAAQLVLQAGLIASRQQEGGQIFVLDMGEPVKIVDLARDLIRLSGFTEDEIKIEFTGLRPGEKLYEELLADGESTLPTPHPKLRIAKPSATPDAQWLADLEQWLAVPSRTEADVKQGLKARVPEYQPSVH
ncbi:polysaccharide biosynthesis protein [Sulfuritalea hydrogenivorans]|uniref:Putative nucleoside-diphosphate sugar epimerase n=1 Tax=Sulfuritalea hydrogenivorans sk43H TaxID=1223802 RepID=W0SI37_9PROT|nr:nucleoside-diphosphate sugar epimerase/dehydratase [Sulfuritalea hydrogenivorans]BAO31114.1 putative nucleoside-diphosphate sugar epimerase [Sulfuritalea hydrogenivorans sk43H]